MKDNVSKTVSDHLCVGCGVCQDVCPVNCISIEHGNTNYPIVDNNACVECGKCLKLCPGKGVNLKKRAYELFTEGEFKENEYLGRYLNCYSGYSTDNNVRYHCASGGCLSQFLIYLLDKEIIDGAVVTAFKENAPMTPYTYVARTKEEVLNGKSSKYCVVSYDGITKDIKRNPGKYVLVGLPCHIQAFRKLADVDKCVRESIIGYFPIFCSSNKNMDSQKYILWRYKIDIKSLMEFAYRDEGCLGKMFFRDKNRTPLCEPIDFLDFYRGMRAFFNVPRCNVCSDFFGELGDVCFGDLNKDDKDDDPIGVNSIIVRSDYWLDLLKMCCIDGYLKLYEIDEQKMIDAQTYCSSYKKGEGFYATMNLRKIFGYKNPLYDNLHDIHPGFKAYLKAVEKVVMYYVGKHRWMWPIIKMLDKNKKNHE